MLIGGFMGNYLFFLGGMDAEMVEIKRLLASLGQQMVDKGLGWGAKASAYAKELGSISTGNTPVLVELELDITIPEGAVVVDHHGDRSEEPASITQVLNLLGIEPNHWQTLIAANDSGWFPGLQAAGATPEEMAAVRSAERSAQGITPEQETEAELALAAQVEMVGSIRIIRMSHSKTAPVGDAIAIAAIAAGKPVPPYLILSGDGEVNFSGQGDLAQAIHEKFVGGWAGGAGLGKADGTAYWGGYPNHDELLKFVMEAR
jgi:hypothetical protein